MRFKKTLLARKILKENNLSLLKIPKPKLIHLNISGKSIPIIVETKLNLEEDEDVIQNEYKTAGSDLDNAIEQLAKFILLTNWTDVCYRNAPLLSCKVDNTEKSFFKIVLPDLEETNPSLKNMESQLLGLIGNNFKDGFIHMATSEIQIEKICAIAKEFKLPSLIISDATTRKIEQLKNEQFILNIYKKKRIVNSSLRKIDIPSLYNDLNFNDKQKRLLRTAAKNILNEIGERLRLNNKKHSLIKQRQVKLNSIHPIFILGDPEKLNLKRKLRHSKIFSSEKNYSSYVLDKEKKYLFNKSDTVLGIIINALVEKGHLIKNYTLESDSNWTLQA